MAPRKQAQASRTPEIKTPIDREETDFDFSMFDIKKLRKRVIFGLLITEDSRKKVVSQIMDDVLDGLKAAGIIGFLEFGLSRYSLMRLVEFFYNSRIEGDVIRSRVNERDVEITEERWRSFFNINAEGLRNLSQEQPPDMDNFIEHCKSYRCTVSTGVSMKVSGLKEELRYLAAMVSKEIMGQIGSHDTMSASKFTMIYWILEKKKVNWMKFIWPALKSQVQNFGVVQNSEGRWELSHGISMALQLSHYLMQHGCIAIDEGTHLEEGKILAGAKELPPDSEDEGTERRSVPAAPVPAPPKQRKQSRPKEKGITIAGSAQKKKKSVPAPTKGKGKKVALMLHDSETDSESDTDFQIARWIQRHEGPGESAAAIERFEEGLIDLTLGRTESEVELTHHTEPAGLAAGTVEREATGSEPMDTDVLVPETSPLRDEAVEEIHLAEPTASHIQEIAQAAISGVIAPSPDSTIPFEKEQGCFRLWRSVREMEAGPLEQYFRTFGFGQYSQAEAVVKAFCGVNHISEISTELFEAILHSKIDLLEKSVPEDEEEGAEAEDEEEGAEAEDEEGEGGGSDHDDDHHGDDDFNEGGGAMIIPSSDSEAEVSGAESMEAAPEGEQPSPSSSEGAGELSQELVLMTNPTTLLPRNQIQISSEIMAILKNTFEFFAGANPPRTSVQLREIEDQAEEETEHISESELFDVSIIEEVTLPSSEEMRTEREPELRTRELVPVSEEDVEETAGEIELIEQSDKYKNKGKGAEPSHISVDINAPPRPTFAAFPEELRQMFTEMVLYLEDLIKKKFKEAREDTFEIKTDVLSEQHEISLTTGHLNSHAETIEKQIQNLNSSWLPTLRTFGERLQSVEQSQTKMNAELNKISASQSGTEGTLQTISERMESIGRLVQDDLRMHNSIHSEVEARRLAEEEHDPVAERKKGEECRVSASRRRRRRRDDDEDPEAQGSPKRRRTGSSAPSHGTESRRSSRSQVTTSPRSESGRQRSTQLDLQEFVLTPTSELVRRTAESSRAESSGRGGRRGRGRR